MEYETIPAAFREAIATFSVFRAMGYPSEEIFVSRNHDTRCMMVILKHRGKDFRVDTGRYDSETWSEEWRDLAIAVNDGKVEDRVMRRIWLESNTHRNLEHMVLVMLNKGFYDLKALS